MLQNCTYMFHATQVHVLGLFLSCTHGVGGGRGCMRCLVTHVGCYRTAHTCSMLRKCMCSDCSYHARMGWGGWAWLHALSCHTCWMLQNCTYMFHATQVHVLGLFVSCTDRVGGVGVVACVVLSHMLDATELHIHVQCYASACARTVLIMHAWGGGVGVVACVVLSHMLDATELHGVGGGVGGVGVVACAVLSHMLDATELHIHVSCYASACARTVVVVQYMLTATKLGNQSLNVAL